MINPGYLVKGEEAEAALLEQVATSALESGATEVRLRPMYQNDGDAFYNRCGFFGDEADAESAERILLFQTGAAPADAAPAAAADEPPAVDEPAATGALAEPAPPEGFEWGVVL